MEGSDDGLKRSGGGLTMGRAAGGRSADWRPVVTTRVITGRGMRWDAYVDA